MKHDEIINIQKTIGHWANNCGGCETCEREFGGQEEPTFDMQTVFEICAAYTDALKILEEMSEALDRISREYWNEDARAITDKYRVWIEGMK